MIAWAHGLLRACLRSRLSSCVCTWAWSDRIRHSSSVWTFHSTKCVLRGRLPEVRDQAVVARTWLHSTLFTSVDIATLARSHLEGWALLVTRTLAMGRFVVSWTRIVFLNVLIDGVRYHMHMNAGA